MGNWNPSGPPGGGHAPPGAGYGPPPGGNPSPSPGDGYGAPPAPAYGAPPMGGYGAPPVGGYGAPPVGGYGAPPVPAGYGAPPPPAGGFGQPGYGSPPVVGFGAPLPYGMQPMSNFAVRGSIGLGFLAGFFGGCVGLALVYMMAKGPDTKKGASIGFATGIGIGIVARIISSL